MWNERQAKNNCWRVYNTSSINNRNFLFHKVKNNAVNHVKYNIVSFLFY